MEQEQGWILRIQRRNSRKDAERLIQAYYDEIYVYAYRQTGNKEDALDLTQEIFLSVLRSIKSYRPEKAAFRTWLYRIATNKIIDERRRRRLNLVDIDDIDMPDEMDYLRQSEHRLLLKQIDLYASRQDGTVERIFRMRLYQGLSFREIWDALDMPEATVKTKYHRLCQNIRKEFGHAYSDAE